MASCTDSAASPWWAVDLGQMYQISHVDVTTPDIDEYRNYHLTTYSVNLTDTETPVVVAYSVFSSSPVSGASTVRRSGHSTFSWSVEITSIFSVQVTWILNERLLITGCAVAPALC